MRGVLIYSNGSQGNSNKMKDNRKQKREKRRPKLLANERKNQPGGFSQEHSSNK